MRRFDFSTAAEWKVEDAVVALSRAGQVRMVAAGAVGKLSAVLAPAEFSDAMAELNVVTDDELAEIEAAEE